MAPIIDKPVNVLKIMRTNVLDDDTEMNEVLETVFKTYGLPNVHFYEDSDLFLKETDENVHLCFLDWKLKEDPKIWNGLHVAKLLKSRYPKIKIVFVTSYVHPKFMQELINIHVDGFINKDDPDYMTQMVDITKFTVEQIRRNMEFAQMLEEDVKNR